MFFLLFREHPDSHLIIHYEDVIDRFEETVRRIEKFLDLQAMSDDDVTNLKSLTSLNSVKDRMENNRPIVKERPFN